MTVFEAIRDRRSIRSYTPHPIPPEKLEVCLEAMRLANSGGNRQPWRFVLVQEADLRQQMAVACNGQSWVAEAPLIVVACALTTASEKGANVNLSIPIDHLQLAAHEQGLGTCWIGAFQEEQVKQLLNIPAEVRVVHVMTVGFAAAAGKDRGRKPQEEIFAYNRW
ncbi:MAG: nitroreductase family protein [Symbiobacteriaceae bacterium]|nr:nitroreductase family protein [Symbiobacteriaceae bacterium]